MSELRGVSARSVAWVVFFLILPAIAVADDEKFDAKTESKSQNKAEAAQKKGDFTGWTWDFSADKADLASVGRNPYFILEPGYQLVLEGGETRLVVSVLRETQKVDGVETRVVEERESMNGRPIEISRNFFAISKRTNNVYYFGEEVDEYKYGKIVGHPGVWRSGENGAKFGLLVPGLPLVSSRYYQEVAPKTAMDRAQVIAVDEVVKTPAGEFKNVLRIEETTPLEPDVVDHKYYAPGIGLVQDGNLKLVKYGVDIVALANDAADGSATRAASEDADDDDDEKIPFANAPAAVQKTLRREAGSAEIKEVEKSTDEGKVVYEAEVTIDGHEYVISVAEDGTLLEKELEDDEEETPVKFEDVPAAARKTLTREAFGAKFEKVDKLVREGRTLYETDVKIDGKNYSIVVTAEGLLLSKELDEGEDDEKEDGE
jgi:hypothetical protein